MTTGRPRASSREVLSEAACELFLERGFDATSITDISARAGVSRSSFFNYFESKEAILWSSLDGRIETLRAETPVVDAAAALMDMCRDLQPDSLALALVNAHAMGLVDELERGAAVRSARIAAAVSTSLVAAGADPVSAAICGAAHAGAVMVSIERWARAGAGRASLSDELAHALAVAAVTLPDARAGKQLPLD
ncbi:TetR/AcrR family transcriptional regulator [Microbacterium oleivorans]|uniref:TetR/AcrR family transcriptional regulator n=1 Tax=Microbacterium oleivorans TaxID=273677 RepID=UPI00080E25F0|nr:TetR/AcrR family transcriptional regulator [Microbacterium oleivorans]